MSQSTISPEMLEELIGTAGGNRLPWGPLVTNAKDEDDFDDDEDFDDDDFDDEEEEGEDAFYDEEFSEFLGGSTDDDEYDSGDDDDFSDLEGFDDEDTADDFDDDNDY